MLNASRIELGRLSIEPKPTDIAALIKSNVAEVAPLAAEKNVTIKTNVRDLPQISLDPLLINQVLHNLLTNAIRYSSKTDAQVDISAKMTQTNLEIRVSDNGIGIPSDAQAHLFERFYRAENAKKAVQDGSGLGLYLVKIILKESGGDVHVTSQENKGTTFTVLLPKTGMRSREGDRKLS